MKKRFLDPRLIGPRYEEGSVPLEVFREWASFEELVLDLARHLYLQDHQDRQRVPRGFIGGFTLHVSGIGEGSAAPQIDRVFLGDREENPDNEAYYSRARDLLLAVIAAAALGNPIPPEFPENLLPRFDRLGRSLRETESVEFILPDADRPAAVLNRETYKRLALRAAREYQAETELLGRVTEFDIAKKSFQFSLLDGTRVAGTWTQETKGPIYEAFEGCFEDRLKVRLLAFALLDADDRPKRLVEVLRVEELDSLDVPARLEELKALREGWLDGEGDALDPRGLSWLSEAWLEHFPDSLPNPYVYPTPTGGVQLEWTLGSWEISAEIDLLSKRTYFTAADTEAEADSVEEAHFDLTTPNDWRNLAAAVHRLAEAAG